MTPTTTTSGTKTSQFAVHRAADRGHVDFGWLQSRHSFSFGDYHNPRRMGFRSLRVINDDDIAPAAGFGEHPHRDMEIITWILAGALTHADSTGGGGIIKPGDVQVMTAGRGVRHSEFNASKTESAKLLQIWIEPSEGGLEPHYDQRHFDADGRRNSWQLIVTGDELRKEAMHIHQDAALSIADLDAKKQVSARIDDGRYGYLHIAFGEVDVNGQTLRAGDALEITGPADLSITAKQQSELLSFDLA